MIETIRWRDDAVELLDQRALPATTSFVRCENATQVADAIRNMTVRGAPAIGVAAAYGIAVEAHAQRGSSRSDFDSAIQNALNTLAGSRPTAVNLFWALDKMRIVLRQQGHLNSSAIAELLLKHAIEIHGDDIKTNLQLGDNGAPLIPDGARVLTHCNAGALATAGHGTALGIIRSAKAAGKTLSVFADETRPLLQGARLTAWELMTDNIPVTLITDSMSGHLMSKGEIDLVIVGADRVAANGDVANKIGTYMVAVLAKRHNIPFLVACPISTVDLETPSGKEIVIEERGGNEIRGFGTVRWCPEGVLVRNPAFDVTPAELITAWVTELGVVRQPFAQGLSLLFSSNSNPT